MKSIRKGLYNRLKLTKLYNNLKNNTIEIEDNEYEDLMQYNNINKKTNDYLCKLTLNNNSIVIYKEYGKITKEMISLYRLTLGEIKIGLRCTGIGDGAFVGCVNLTNIVIPNTVTNIENQAFYGCNNLISITIGKNVVNIGNSIFYGCNNLVNIKIDDENTVYDSRNNCNAIIKTDNNSLIQGCKSTIIPNDVICIENNAFDSFSNLTSINIPDSVIRINDSAFNNCSNLTSITIPDSVTYIGMGAFRCCNNLTDVTIGKGIKNIYNNAFQYCTSLTNITINAIKAPNIEFNTFEEINSDGILTVPKDSTGYNVFMDTYYYYLGYYNWTKIEQ